MAVAPATRYLTAVNGSWLDERQIPARDFQFSLESGEAQRNTTGLFGANSKTYSEIFMVVIRLLYAAGVSFVAWTVLGSVLTGLMIPFKGKHDRPLVKERFKFAIGPAIMMSALQGGVMIMRAQTPMEVSYRVKMVGPQEVFETSPLWRLAAGSWFLTLGISLTIAGVGSIAVHAGYWKK